MHKTLVLLGNLPAEAMSSLAVSASAAGGDLSHAPDLEHALSLAGQGAAALLVVAEGQDLPAFFAAVKGNHLTLPVIVLGPAQPAAGAKAIRLGALDYLSLPLEPRLLGALLDKLLTGAGAIGGTHGSDQISGGHHGTIAADGKTRALLQQAEKFAASSATVLLRGESGTGKEVFARYIHQHSPRKNAAFVAVNCAAIPENLLESELFGHEKGAFSGALARRLGKFQQAHGGTLLLDEISEMDLGLQAKLLRAIQEKVVDPIGADKPISVDFRLIATTNRELESYVAEGKFREDLYFRLGVVTLEIPPLRERPGDIVPLAQHFATQYRETAYGGTKVKLPPVTLSESAVDKLLGCYWKGNVRELENTLHRAVLLAGPSELIDADHIVLSPMSLQHMSVGANNAQSATQPTGPSAAPLAQAVAQAYGSAGAAPAPFIPKTLASAERDMLLDTLGYTRGNRQHAADLLGISVLILKEKLVSLGLAE